MIEIFRKYRDALEVTKDPQAAATLILADRMSVFDDLDHLLCMGIRMGLFGSSASNHASLDNTIAHLSEAIAEMD